MDSYRGKHRSLAYAFTDHHSQLQVIRASSQAERNTERAIDGLINATFKIPQVLSLATLLDSRNGGGDPGPSNQCPADDSVKKKPEKKKRRG